MWLEVHAYSSIIWSSEKRELQVQNNLGYIELQARLGNFSETLTHKSDSIYNSIEKEQNTQE